jgi:hypothetical protein
MDDHHLSYITKLKKKKNPDPTTNRDFSSRWMKLEKSGIPGIYISMNPLCWHNFLREKRLQRVKTNNPCFFDRMMKLSHLSCSKEPFFGPTKPKP